MTRSCLTLALLGSTLLFACKDAPKPAPEAAPAMPAVAAPAKKADPDVGLSPAQRLALQKIAGSSKADALVDAAQALVRANPTKNDSWVTLGRAWIAKARESADPGFYLNANACADVVLAIDPDHFGALDVRGLVLMNNHEFEKARALAEAITKRHPDDPMAWGTLSDADLELGRYEEAIAAAQTMIDLKPNLPSYSRASYLQWMRGDAASAKATVRAALDAGRDTKRDPEPGAWVLVQAAMIFWHEGDLDGADAGFDKALERVNGFAPANVGKGRVAMAKHDYRRAAELFGRAHQASPLVETAWLLGDAREAAGDHDGAARAWAEAEREGKKTDPRTLSLFWSTKGTHADEAVALARKEYEVRKDVYTEDALAWALYRSGKLAEASEHVVHARRLGTPDARLVYHEGAIRIATGDAAKGRALVATAVKTGTLDAASARDAERLLADPVASR